MKKFNLKSCVCGFMAGVTAMCCVPTIAKDISTAINVTYRNIKIYADGNLVNTSDGNEAFIYNGTTYLPVRAVGEAFNKAVDWDAKTSSVYVGTKPFASSQPTVLLEDLDYFTSEVGFESGSYKDNTGTLHSTGILFDYGDTGNIEYLLNGRYSRFAGTVILPYDERDYTRNKAVIKIFGDDKLLYTSPEMKAGTMPSNFNVDITGVLKLKITVEEPDYTDWANFTHAAIVDAGFYS